MNVSACLIYGVPALTLVITAVALARKVGLPSKYAPAMSIGCGLLAGVVMGLTQDSVGIGTGIVAGIMLGASACGIYDTGKVSTTTTAATVEATAAETTSQANAEVVA